MAHPRPRDPRRCACRCNS
ncbi:hypothetical protein FDA94_13300 [Herbidospora galbida]|uniref:Uncharacterized protein n=1 Tax=Herbidospora galbida TaxID=2575442 RepID=A0A4U3MGV7_9ACTN|nr:hypothetical protein FDA94_13300 [Herbidospora galbida]